MRYQKVYTFLALVALGPSLAFSQTALPVQGSDSEGDEISEQMRLETEADSAESRVATAIITLEKFEQSGNNSNSLAFSHRQLELKAELARADFSASQARVAAMKSYLLSSQNRTGTDAKYADGSRRNKNTQSPNKDTIAETDIAKANEEALRKGKIAVEATTKAQAAYKELKAAQARELEMQAKDEEDEQTSRLREANLSPTVRQALAIQAEAQKARATVEAAVLERSRRAQMQAKVEAELEAQLKAEEEKAAARKAKANEDAFKEAFQRAKQVAEQKRQAAQVKDVEKETLNTTQIAVEEKPITEEEALQQAIARLDAIESQKTDSKKSPDNKTVRKVIYSGTLFSIVRDDPLEEELVQGEATTAAR